ncbi:unnamed protein product [Closterium sp. NIES-53]
MGIFNPIFTATNTPGEPPPPPRPPPLTLKERDGATEARWLPLRCALCPLQASAFCAADRAVLCATCDQDIHASSAIFSRHRRFSLCALCSRLSTASLPAAYVASAIAASFAAPASAAVEFAAAAAATPSMPAVAAGSTAVAAVPVCGECGEYAVAAAASCNDSASHGATRRSLDIIPRLSHATDRFRSLKDSLCESSEPQPPHHHAVVTAAHGEGKHHGSSDERRAARRRAAPGDSSIFPLLSVTPLPLLPSESTSSCGSCSCSGSPSASRSGRGSSGGSSISRKQVRLCNEYYPSFKLPKRGIAHGHQAAKAPAAQAAPIAFSGNTWAASARPARGPCAAAAHPAPVPRSTAALPALTSAKAPAPAPGAAWLSLAPTHGCYAQANAGASAGKAAAGIAEGNLARQGPREGGNVGEGAARVGGKRPAKVVGVGVWPMGKRACGGGRRHGEGEGEGEVCFGLAGPLQGTDASAAASAAATAAAAAAASTRAEQLLGAPNSQRLRRVLYCWMAALPEGSSSNPTPTPLLPAATAPAAPPTDPAAPTTSAAAIATDRSIQSLTLHLFTRLITARRLSPPPYSPHAAAPALSSIRVLLAASLWLACKLLVHRKHVPLGRSVAVVSGVPVQQLSRAELELMSALEWAPLKGWLPVGC